MLEAENNLWHLAKPLDGLEPLREDIKADVAVVGGGYTGLSTALHLAQQGKDVVLLEAHDIGYGASGRNVGLTNAGLWVMPQQVEQVLGVERGRRLNQFLIDAPKYVDQLITEYDIDCDYLRNGTLHLAHNKTALKYLDERRRQLLEYDADLKLLDADATFELTQAENYYGGLKDFNAGTLQPLKYCIGLAKLALENGVRIYKQSAVLDLERINGNIRLKTDLGNVTAGKIVLATNGYEQGLSYNNGLYTPVYYCQLASERLSANQRKHCLPANNGCWDSGMVMRSFRTDVEGRLIVGTLGNVYTGTDQINARKVDGFKKWSAHVVKKTFPNVGELRYEFAWAGRIAKSANNLPQLLEVTDGVYQIMGFSGRGIAPATVSGKMLADYLCGKINRKELPLPFNEAKNISYNRLRAVVYEMGCELSHLSDFIVR